MHKPKQHSREPLIYITKRDNVPLKTSILIRAAAIVLALAVCAVVSKVLTGDTRFPCSPRFCTARSAKAGRLSPSTTSPSCSAFPSP